MSDKATQWSAMEAGPDLLDAWQGYFEAQVKLEELRFSGAPKAIEDAVRCIQAAEAKARAAIAKATNAKPSAAGV